MAGASGSPPPEEAPVPPSGEPTVYVPPPVARPSDRVPAGVNVNALRSELGHALDRMPKVEGIGGDVEPELIRDREADADATPHEHGSEQPE